MVSGQRGAVRRNLSIHSIIWPCEEPSEGAAHGIPAHEALLHADAAGPESGRSRRLLCGLHEPAKGVIDTVALEC